jgi:hypothetical protein
MVQYPHYVNPLASKKETSPQNPVHPSQQDPAHIVQPHERSTKPT